ncbi:thioredoxin family protein [Sphingobacterium sp. xlx-130]|uniref:thioredoxin family protein n=1 Tax=Sphingobacterium sp. xlx-130 TaxID=2654323 RepID=UPI0013DBB5A3|nr:thioredoxin family protein [Sphingobacterium sp. xlx-130]
MRKTLVILLIFPFFAVGQQKGINFETSSSWEQVKAKASRDGKHIFVDCFTTWCGPCIWMTENVFPKEEVGTFFNANFVNLKLQMDKTDKDSEEVRSWYDEAIRFAKDYEVRVYPTFLIFSPDGELVHRMIGGAEAEAFIARVKEGLNPQTQYFTLVKRFEDSPNDPIIAKKMIVAAQSAHDEVIASKATEAYLSSVGVEGLLIGDNLDLILRGTTSSTSTSFLIIKDNKVQVDQLLEEKDKPFNSNYILSSILTSELVIPQLKASEANAIDFDKLQAEIEKKHPYVDMTSSIARAKAQYFRGKKNWVEFTNAVDQFVRAGGKHLSPQELNSFALSIFENSNDSACIRSALVWSEKTLESGDNPGFLSTYANLLYKTGDKANAIKWQEKAVAIASVGEKENFKNTLDKMKSGKIILEK